MPIQAESRQFGPIRADLGKVALIQAESRQFNADLGWVALSTAEIGRNTS